MKKSAQVISLLSVMHMGIDFLCAFALYLSLEDWGASLFFVYNFCAFALQLPLGMILDFWQEKDSSFRPGFFFVAAGVLLTVCGTFTAPFILGLGNAFFHVGGGVLSIREDEEAGYGGRGLGVFVAPGALGLTLGMILEASFLPVVFLTGIFLLILCLQLYAKRQELTPALARGRGSEGLTESVLLCFAVVVLRSFIGSSIAFPWRKGTFLILLATLALASGKTAGGFLSYHWGMKKTVVVTLSAAALSYVLGNSLPGGIAALFFFNMTMPLTLYLLVKKMPEAPGLAFGILTFGLFLGYLPVYYGLLRSLSPFPAGTLGALFSLLLLGWTVRREER
ncbi:MAG: hypothetical protein IKE21_08480 [Erysipelotrichaceae bacterium]|nr:hypothetical protein [Erysipelotrichaceae bacterium]